MGSNLDNLNVWPFNNHVYRQQSAFEIQFHLIVVSIFLKRSVKAKQR